MNLNETSAQCAQGKCACSSGKQKNSCGGTRTSFRTKRVRMQAKSVVVAGAIAFSLLLFFAIGLSGAYGEERAKRLYSYGVDGTIVIFNLTHIDDFNYSYCVVSRENGGYTVKVLGDEVVGIMAPVAVDGVSFNVITNVDTDFQVIFSDDFRYVNLLADGELTEVYELVHKGAGALLGYVSQRDYPYAFLRCN